MHVIFLLWVNEETWGYNTGNANKYTIEAKKLILDELNVKSRLLTSVFLCYND